MRGNSASFTKSIILNPLVWIGVVLTGFTLHYEGEHNAFDLFYKPEVYRNLIIGTAIYVGLFGRQYHPGGEKLDVKATLITLYETFFTIWLSWVLTLALVVNYHVGGEMYSLKLREKYQALKGENTQTGNISGLETLQAGKSYRVTPQPDGSMIIDVIED